MTQPARRSLGATEVASVVGQLIAYRGGWARLRLRRATFAITRRPSGARSQRCSDALTLPGRSEIARSMMLGARISDSMPSWLSVIGRSMMLGEPIGARSSKKRTYVRPSAGGRAMGVEVAGRVGADASGTIGGTVATAVISSCHLCPN